MSKYKVGSGSIATAKLQTAFGTAVTPDTLLNMTSESINANYEYTDEGNLLASKTANQRDLSSVTVEGSISTILRPEFADWLFNASLGKKSGDDYILSGPNEDLPVSTVVIGRGGIYKKYKDMTVSSLSISASANDYVKADVSFKGIDEATASSSDAGTTTSFTLPSYRCTKARLLYGNAEASLSITDDIWNACPTNGKLDVESVTFSLDNGLSDAPKTYCSGVYANQPYHGKRSVKVSFTIPYSTDGDTFRNTYYASESAPCLSLLLGFTSADKDENVQIYLPNVHLTSNSANVSGESIIENSVEGEALSIGTTEAVTVKVNHAD